MFQKFNSTTQLDVAASCDPKDGTDRLSQTVGKKLPLLAA